MVRKWSAIVLALCVAFGVGGLLNAQLRGGGGWESLGSAHIDGNVDHDRIKCHGKDTFSAIQLRVNGSAVRFDHVVVVYGNHKSETLPVRSEIRAGGSTQPLVMRGGNRDIAYVDIWYAKAHWGAQPEVNLYGRR